MYTIVYNRAFDSKKVFLFKASHEDRPLSLENVWPWPMATLATSVFLSFKWWSPSLQTTHTHNAPVKTKVTSHINMEGISCESLPPSDFRLYSSLEDSNGAIKVAIENCQLCGSSRRPFFCKDCVNKGRFSHSKCKTGERWVSCHWRFDSWQLSFFLI